MRVFWAVILSSAVGAAVASQTPGVSKPAEGRRSAATPSATQTTDPALHEAVLRRDMRAIESRLASGGDPSAREPGRRTLLMDAVATGDAQVVRVLLRGGAEPRAATATGWTALHEAVSKRQGEALRELLDAGAYPDALDRAEGTPLDVAERGGNADLARLLREGGARGSGKSIGDTVCVRPWSGEGYCGVVDGRSGPTYRVLVSEVVGCKGGCAGIVECTGGRGVLGLAVGATVEVPSSCLTHTGLGRDGGAR